MVPRKATARSTGMFQDPWHLMLAVCTLLPFAGSNALAGGGPDVVDFNRHIRPILSENCFACHGPDKAKRKADLRLDVASGMASATDDHPVIAVGKPEQSELYRRITATDKRRRMPPVKSGKKLSVQQIDSIRRWIEQGARYQVHWSLLPPKMPPLPGVSKPAWLRNPIDSFVLARLERDNLRPAPEAAKTTLIRRVTLDLAGLPPTPEEIDDFLRDESPNAYEKVVDRLLRSPRYGERMALDWLDAARYADTNGYFSDLERQMWRWRDWIIEAFNRNMPFDQFTVEQLAGDLLPGATLEQRIATGFNRNHMVTNESGVIDEEYRVEYVADRVDTTATVWMGLTVGCARCHDHKFDPISQKEYYQLFAFFNNGPERGLIVGKSLPPMIDVPAPAEEKSLADARQRRVESERAFQTFAKPLAADQAAWEATAETSLPVATAAGLIAHYDFDNRLSDVAGRGLHARAQGPARYEPGILGTALELDGTQHAEIAGDLCLESNRPWTVAVWLRPTGPLGCALSKISTGGEHRGFELLWKKGRLALSLVHVPAQSVLEVSTNRSLPSDRWHHVAVVYDGTQKAAGLKLIVNGTVEDVQVHNDSLKGPIATSEPWRIGRQGTGLGFYGRIDELRFYNRVLDVGEVSALHWSDLIRGIVRTQPGKRTPQQQEQLTDYYITHLAQPGVRAAWQALLESRRHDDELRAAIPTTLVMEEMKKPRDTFVLVRGQYDRAGEKVTAGVPTSLPPLPPGIPPNRLGLARWLVSSSHPLTARVTVNRFCQHFFGEGLVRTVNDFGSQGELASHPELLDWLAVQFMASGWDVKALHKLIATSATYRQSSALTPEMLRRDPGNRLLARGPRFRLPAEVIRDQALAVSGLLVRKVGGPSVKPYQPAGLWESVSYNAEQSYVQDRGESLYRQSLYTYWKRQSPPPSILCFDGPTRETCTVKRPRTNTPLQALVLLNDPTFVEAGRALATRMMHAASDSAERIRRGFRLATARAPEADEVDRLLELFRDQRDEYRRDRKAALALLGVGDSPRDATLDPCDLAAWTIVAGVLLNLDEMVTKQ